MPWCFFFFSKVEQFIMFLFERFQSFQKLFNVLAERKMISFKVVNLKFLQVFKMFKVVLKTL